jgi:hypothetical protein
MSSEFVRACVACVVSAPPGLTILIQLIQPRVDAEGAQNHLRASYTAIPAVLLVHVFNCTMLGAMVVMMRCIGTPHDAAPGPVEERE